MINMNMRVPRHHAAVRSPLACPGWLRCRSVRRVCH